jgi:hypothetical protein
LCDGFEQRRRFDINDVATAFDVRDRDAAQFLQGESKVQQVMARWRKQKDLRAVVQSGKFCVKFVHLANEVLDVLLDEFRKHGALEADLTNALIIHSGRKPE